MNEEMRMSDMGGEVSAAELEETMTGGAQALREDEAGEMQDELAARVREGIAELFEDGWTVAELTAFSEDPGAKAAVAAGHSVARAALAYLRALPARKRGVPTATRIATGGCAQENAIEHMTDEQFDAFSRRAHAAMMAGKRVRM